MEYMIGAAVASVVSSILWWLTRPRGPKPETRRGLVQLRDSVELKEVIILEERGAFLRVKWEDSYKEFWLQKPVVMLFDKEYATVQQGR